MLKDLPELPEARRARYRRDFGLSSYDAEVLVAERPLADFFEKAVAGYSQPKIVANWVTQNLMGALNAKGAAIDNSPVTPEQLVELLNLLEHGVINGKQGKDVLVKMVVTGRTAGTIIKEDGLAQVLDEGAVAKWVEEAMKEFPQSVADVRSGKGQAVGFLVGQVMKKSGGKANPGIVNKLLKDRLKVGS